MSENYRIYEGKDGRIRVYLKDSKRVISYPKFLMEQKLGRKLDPSEQVHHIDGNPLNNSLDNLELVTLGNHQREHSTKYQDKIVVCHHCGTAFLWTAKQQRTHYSNLSRKNTKRSDIVFCSKHCLGIYSRLNQLN